MKEFIILFFLIWSTAVPAMTVATPAAGYFRLSAPAGSDTSMVLPLLTPSEGIGHVIGLTANSVLLDLPAVADGQFAPSSGGSYYLQFRTGNLAGLMYRITSSTGSRFQLDSRNADLSNHPLGAVALGVDGDLACIRKCQTIGDILGTGLSLTLLPVTSLTTGAYQEGDAVFVPSDLGEFEIGQPRLVYVASSGWRKTGDTITDVANTALLPGLAFTLRIGPGHGADFFTFGYAPSGRFTLELPATAAGEVRDIHVGLIGAGDVPLQNSGLLTQQSELTPIRSSLDENSLMDVLLSWKDGRIGMGRPPTVRHYAVAQNWYQAGILANEDQLAAGGGYVLRLREGRSRRFWMQTPSY